MHDVLLIVVAVLVTAATRFIPFLIFGEKRKTQPKFDCVFYGGDSWDQNRPSRCSGYKLLSAPVGRYREKTFCLTCNLHIVSHPNNLRQKQKRTACAIRFIFGGDSWNRTNDLMHVKHAL